MAETLFEILGREQSLGEGHARQLHEQGQDAPEVYAAGILAYMEAKAAFDALIEGAKNHLIEGREIKEVEGFRARVEAAVERRTAFTELVRTRLLAFEATTKGGWSDALNPEKWIKPIFDGILSLLKAAREADETRRKETLAQLDGLKWRPFEVLVRG